MSQTNTSETNTGKYINQQTLENLRMLNDGTTNLLVELIKMYNTAAPEKLAKMQSAFREKNYKGLGDVAHSLKSSSGNLGAMSVHKMCQELESNSHKNNLDFPFQEALEKLQDEIKNVLIELNIEMEKELATTSKEAS